MPDPRTTPLDALHRELGARMVDFAGWSMPVQYPKGILKEHLWTRSKASLYDVSHMGQISMPGADAVGALSGSVLRAAPAWLGASRCSAPGAW